MSKRIVFPATLADVETAVAAVIPLVDAAHSSAITTAAADATAKDVATKNDAAADATSKANAAKTDADTKAAQALTAANNAMNAVSLLPSRIRTKRIAVPAMLVGASQVVNVVRDTPFPSLNYTIPRPGLTGAFVLDIQVSAKTLTGCTVTLKNTGLIALLAAAATLEILAIHDPLS